MLLFFAALMQSEVFRSPGIKHFSATAGEYSFVVVGARGANPRSDKGKGNGESTNGEFGKQICGILRIPSNQVLTIFVGSPGNGRFGGDYGGKDGTPLQGNKYSGGGGGASYISFQSGDKLVIAGGGQGGKANGYPGGLGGNGGKRSYTRNYVELSDTCNARQSSNGYIEINPICPSNCGECKQSSNQCKVCKNGFDNVDGVCIKKPPQTPIFTPIITPFTTAIITPQNTPLLTPIGTPMITFETTPVITNVETPMITYETTPLITPYVSPYLTPFETYHQTPLITMFDTPGITPIQTYYQTPASTYEQTPFITQFSTPLSTINIPEDPKFQTPFETMVITESETPFETAMITEFQTPFQTVFNTEEETPFGTPVLTPVITEFQTPFETAFLTPFVTEAETPVQTPLLTEKETPVGTPFKTAHTTPVITAATTPGITPLLTPKETEIHVITSKPKPVFIERTKEQIPKKHKKEAVLGMTLNLAAVMI